MQPDKNQVKQAELNTLEQLILHRRIRSYGAFCRFRMLLNKYPLQFLQFMKRHRGRPAGEERDSADLSLPLVVKRVGELQHRFREYLVNEAKREAGKKEFDELAEKLEALLLRQNEEN